MLKKGDKVEAIILSVDKESKKITLGVKQLSTNPWETIERSLPVGTLVHGVVTKTTAFGAFVQLDSGIEALIHVTELSDQPFGKVEDVVAKGDEVTAKVIKLDPEHKKIALSISKTAMTSSSVRRPKRVRKRHVNATIATTKKNYNVQGPLFKRGAYYI